jgi:hypothetical protein
LTTTRFGNVNNTLLTQKSALELLKDFSYLTPQITYRKVPLVYTIIPICQGNRKYAILAQLHWAQRIEYCYFMARDFQILIHISQTDPRSRASAKSPQEIYR